MSAIDKTTRDKIAIAHPRVRQELEDIVEHINTKILTGEAKVRITSTLRTWEEQEELYAQGRTKPGPKVTNAKAGDSVHNFGLGFDIVLIINGRAASWDVKKDWDKDRQSDWMEVVTYCKSKGWRWGGDWISWKDMPHMEKTFGYTVKQLKELYLAKDFIPGTTYVKTK